jgi:drug/metabolite transporter (DMT)-like permease
MANICYGVAGFIGTGLIIYGFKHIEAHKGSIVLLSEIIFSVLFGTLIFNELLNFTTILGGILIMLAGILPNVYRVQRN